MKERNWCWRIVLHVKYPDLNFPIRVVVAVEGMTLGYASLAARAQVLQGVDYRIPAAGGPATEAVLVEAEIVGECKELRL